MVQKIINELEEMYGRYSEGSLRTEEVEAFVMNHIIGQAENVVNAGAFAQDVARWYVALDFDSMSEEEEFKCQLTAGALCLIVGTAMMVQTIDEVESK